MIRSTSGIVSSIHDVWASEHGLHHDEEINSVNPPLLIWIDTLLQTLYHHLGWSFYVAFPGALPQNHLRISVNEIYFKLFLRINTGLHLHNITCRVVSRRYSRGTGSTSNGYNLNGELMKTFCDGKKYLNFPDFKNFRKIIRQILTC